MGSCVIISLLEKEIRAEQEFCQGTVLCGNGLWPVQDGSEGE